MRMKVLRSRDTRRKSSTLTHPRSHRKPNRYAFVSVITAKLYLAVIDHMAHTAKVRCNPKLRLPVQQRHAHIHE